MANKEIVTVKMRAGHKFTQDISTQVHSLVSDEPQTVGGDDLGMSPYELLLSSLGSCTSMTMKMYADQKGWDLQEVIVTLSHEKIHAEDCADCETKKGRIDHITKEIQVRGDLDEAQVARLMEISERCPVNRTLKSEIFIESSLKSDSD